MSLRDIPACCRDCLNFKPDDFICGLYEHLPGEYSREEEKTCPSYVSRTENEDQLNQLVRYIDSDPESLVSNALSKVVENIVANYDTKFKVTLIAIARRKIKSIVTSADITDRLLDRLKETDVTNMTAGQTIRLLSELNMSVNNDLNFITKLLSAEKGLQDVQAYIDNRQVNINVAQSQADVSSSVQSILNLSSTSRERLRDAFQDLLKTVCKPDEGNPLEIREEESE